VFVALNWDDLWLGVIG